MPTPVSFLPETPDLFLVYAGMETDLIFTQGVDLPGFAAFPLLGTKAGRALLKGYATDLIELARARGCGAILETPTWMANIARARPLGYDEMTLAARNREGIALMEEARREAGYAPVLVSLNVGPASDAYAPGEQMTDAEAETYHGAQLDAAHRGALDVVTGYTLAYPAEAIGLVRAAQARGLPVVISFTVETDGRLPTGLPLKTAIDEVDAATGQGAAFFMINCAHPDHVEGVFRGGPGHPRLKGFVANASRCSHAELDEALTLDAGDPVELGRGIAALRRRAPQLRVLGGCCGTDLRHLHEIAQSAGATRDA